MEKEQDIQNGLITRFKFLDGKARIQREKRIFIDVDHENFQGVFRYVMEELKFSILITITGLDEGERLGFIYHLSRQDGVILSLKTSVPKAQPVIETIIRQFPNAEIYEREVMDLLGVQVKGLPPGKRYPLPDDWPAGQFPLRKDWKK